MDINCLTLNKDVVIDEDGGLFHLSSPINGLEYQLLKASNLGVQLPFASLEGGNSDNDSKLVESPWQVLVPNDFAQDNLDQQPYILQGNPSHGEHADLDEGVSTLHLE